MAKQNLWTREELILAFNLYLKLPFGKMHKNTPEVIVLAHLIGRTPSSIAMRLGNFASVDPYHKGRGVGGLKGGMNQVKPIWDEFFNNQEELIFLSEKIMAQKENTTVEKKYKDLLFDIDLKGENVVRTVKTRVNQYVFREMVIANYDTRCAITNIDIPQLLFASHIIPWSVNEKERLNPENGICLSPLYDKAFDKGLIGINTNYQIVLSSKLKQKKETDFYYKHFAPIEKQKIMEPLNYCPRKEFLQYHLDEIFDK